MKLASLSTPASPPTPSRIEPAETLQFLVAEDVQVAERRWFVADAGQECRELRRCRTVGILQALVVGGELHHQQVEVVGGTVPPEHRTMRDATACGSADPCVEVVVEVVDPTGFELNDLREPHHILASRTMLKG